MVYGIFSLKIYIFIHYFVLYMIILPFKNKKLIIIMYFMRIALFNISNVLKL